LGGELVDGWGFDNVMTCASQRVVTLIIRQEKYEIGFFFRPEKPTEKTQG